MFNIEAETWTWRGVPLKKSYVTLKRQKLVRGVAGYFLVFQQKMPGRCYVCLCKNVNASQRHLSRLVPWRWRNHTDDSAFRKGQTMAVVAPLLCHQRYEHEAGCWALAHGGWYEFMRLEFKTLTSCGNPEQSLSHWMVSRLELWEFGKTLLAQLFHQRKESRANWTSDLRSRLVFSGFPAHKGKFSIETQPGGPARSRNGCWTWACELGYLSPVGSVSSSHLSFPSCWCYFPGEAILRYKGTAGKKNNKDGVAKRRKSK